MKYGKKQFLAIFSVFEFWSKMSPYFWTCPKEKVHIKYKDDKSKCGKIMVKKLWHFEYKKKENLKKNLKI